HFKEDINPASVGHFHDGIDNFLSGSVDEDISTHLLRQIQPVFYNVDSEDLAGSERFAKPNQTSANGTATKDCDRVCRNVRGRRSMNSVTQRFLSACRLNRNSPVVPPRATLVKSMILSKAPVSVDSPQEHPFTDVPIPGPTLKTSSTVNVSLARD